MLGNGQLFQNTGQVKREGRRPLAGEGRIGFSQEFSLQKKTKYLISEAYRKPQGYLIFVRRDAMKLWVSPPGFHHL